MNPFEYAHDLVTKERYDGEVPDRKDYKQFLINRTLSYDKELIHHINYLNQLPDVNDKLHYDFIHKSTQKKKRKKNYWAKAKKFENLKYVKEYYKYSTQKALTTLSVLSDKQIETIKASLYKGGGS